MVTDDGSHMTSNWGLVNSDGGPVTSDGGPVTGDDVTSSDGGTSNGEGDSCDVEMMVEKQPNERDQQREEGELSDNGSPEDGVTASHVTTDYHMICVHNVYFYIALHPTVQTP